MAAATIDDLLAREDIKAVLHRYCRSMDRIDAALGYTVWHEGGIADYGPLFNGTGREFIDWVCDYHRTLQAQSHQILNMTIDVKGDRASSETYVTVGLLFLEDGVQKLTTGRGRYLDKWSRRDGRWAIDHRHFVLDFAFTAAVDATIGWATRDLNDPSYAVLGAAGAA